MSKAILVMDMPETCSNCEYCALWDNYVCELKDDKFVDCVEPTSKPEWCPLKPLPEKFTNFEFDVMSYQRYKQGYNACIEEILSR